MRAGFLSIKQQNSSIYSTWCMNFKWQLQHCLYVCISNVILHNLHYLQACALVRERRAKETCDNAHDCLRYITLQHGICMLPVTGVVAHLGKDRKDISMTHSHWITLPAHGWVMGNIMFIACCVDIINQTHDIIWSRIALSHYTIHSHCLTDNSWSHFEMSNTLWLTLQMSTRKFSNSFHIWLEV